MVVVPKYKATESGGMRVWGGAVPKVVVVATARYP